MNELLTGYKFNPLCLNISKLSTVTSHLCRVTKTTKVVIVEPYEAKQFLVAMKSFQLDWQLLESFRLETGDL